MVRRWLPLALVLGLVAIAEARPGGGNSSSGGSRTRPSSSSSSSSRSSSSSSSSSRSSSSSSSSRSSSSPSSSRSSSSTSSGGSGGSSNVGLYSVLVLCGLIGAGALVVWLVNRRQRGPTVIQSAPEPCDLSVLQRADPAFSLPVFEAFVFELVAAVHCGRSDPRLRAFQRYLSTAAIAHLAGRGSVPTQVVIGALRVEGHSTISENRDQLSVEVEATLFGGGSKPRSIVEAWKFVRRIGTTSRAPTGLARAWPCPGCGAASRSGTATTCEHCGAAIEVGDFNWHVDRMWLVRETDGVASLTGTVAELGNDLPTVRQPSVDFTMQQLTAVDEHVTMQTLTPRIELIYRQLNTAWNANDLTPVRGFVTASLRNYLDYWLREYGSQGLRNTLDAARITKLDLAKITRDRYYNAITVRVFAVGHDFTSDARGKVVGGSKKKKRPYTEYWTFLRSASRSGPVTTSTTCPNCGAPLQISDIGDCTHCNAAVENGSFDWTLSKIEQDDSYSG